jgi:succinoglycan biosynthesis protein ExoM
VELLSRLLNRLLEQQTDDAFTFSCIVIDNDQKRSAEKTVGVFQGLQKLEFIYDCEPERNFAVVRNRAIQKSRGDFIAFIDDDEVPEKDWLLKLLQTCDQFKCDGVLGPVRPYFENEPPRWLDRSGLCHRPIHPTGLILNWQQTRSGNCLLRRNIFFENGIRFDPAYRTGGEDVDFFKRAIGAGKKFVWCEEAPAYELVPPERMRVTYYLRRALLQGTISLKYALGKNHIADRAKIILKSGSALAIYTLALPFLFISGTHRFVRCLVKACHHLGRLSALCGMPIIHERKL